MSLGNSGCLPWPCPGQSLFFLHSARVQTMKETRVNTAYRVLSSLFRPSNNNHRALQRPCHALRAWVLFYLIRSLTKARLKWHSLLSNPQYLLTESLTQNSHTEYDLSTLCSFMHISTVACFLHFWLEWEEILNTHICMRSRGIPCEESWRDFWWTPEDCFSFLTFCPFSSHHFTQEWLPSRYLVSLPSVSQLLIIFTEIQRHCI